MGDWATVEPRVVPGAKAYLFTGSAGNAIDWLVAKATTGVIHRYTVRPPLCADDLGVVLGTTEESQVIIVRGTENAREADWQLVARYLHAPRARGQSLVLVGTSTPEADDLRPRIGRSGFVVDVADPTGVVGRRNLVGWLGEHWQTTVAAATRACERADYSIEALVWSTRVFRALTSEQPVGGSLALQLVDLAVPLRPTDAAYRLLLSRKPEAVRAVRGLDRSQTRYLLHRLEAALTDINLLYPVLSSGHSAKSSADRTGIHIVRVLELAEWAPRYPPGVALRCRQALALGLGQEHQPEAASTVAMLWS